MLAIFSQRGNAGNREWEVNLRFIPSPGLCHHPCYQQVKWVLFNFFFFGFFSLMVLTRTSILCSALPLGDKEQPLASWQLFCNQLLNCLWLWSAHRHLKLVVRKQRLSADSKSYSGNPLSHRFLRLGFSHSVPNFSLKGGCYSGTGKCL